MKVLILNKELKEKHKKQITETAEKVGAEVCFAESEDSIPEEFREAEVFYGYGMKIANTNKKLKWYCSATAGVDFLVKPGAFANEDCIITNSAGAYGVSIAEHIIMVSLMMLRQADKNFRKAFAGQWGDILPQKSLNDCRITVLGTGDIGSTFAKRVRAFEPAQLIGVCRSGVCKEPVFDKVYKVDDLDKVLPETDLLVMSLPGTPETEGILSKERMELLPDDAYVVNVGRGSAVDEEALAECLENDKLAGAALDVFAKEPISEDSYLWNTKNLLITPHTAGNLTLAHTLDRNVEMFCEDLVDYAEGKPLQYVVDKKRGY